MSLIGAVLRNESVSRGLFVVRITGLGGSTKAAAQEERGGRRSSSGRLAE
ncbi:hypothetical protein [Streptomyces sp. NPDC005148]